MRRESSNLKWSRCVPWIVLLVLVPAVLSAQSEIPWIAGPGTMDLGDQAEIYVDENYLFADAETTQQIMQMLGNQVSGQELGLVAPAPGVFIGMIPQVDERRRRHLLNLAIQLEIDR